MRALTIALCLLATPALADVAGVASVINAPESCRSMWVNNGSPAWASECPLLGVKRTLWRTCPHVCF